MQKYAVIAVAWTFIIIAVMALAVGNDASSTSSKTISALPASLDNFYPPQSDAPLYYIAMMDLTTPFSGIVVDLFENDLENARSNFDRFKLKYIEVSKMVPEWQSEYALAPVEELAAAMETGDPAKIMPAFAKVDRVCHTCHMKTMAPVQFKYRWGDFGAISLTDPLTNEDIIFSRLMQLVATNLTGIGIDTEQEQQTNAMKQLEAFRLRFETLKESCEACHDSERKYFVDESVTSLFDDLKLRLSAETVEAGAVGGLLQSIGQESCAKCHLVHAPSALANERHVEIQ